MDEFNVGGNGIEQQIKVASFAINQNPWTVEPIIERLFQWVLLVKFKNSDDDEQTSINTVDLRPFFPSFSTPQIPLALQLARLNKQWQSTFFRLLSRYCILVYRRSSSIKCWNQPELVLFRRDPDIEDNEKAGRNYYLGFIVSSNLLRKLIGLGYFHDFTLRTNLSPIFVGKNIIANGSGCQCQICLFFRLILCHYQVKETTKFCHKMPNGKYDKVNNNNKSTVAIEHLDVVEEITQSVKRTLVNLIRMEPVILTFRVTLGSLLNEFSFYSMHSRRRLNQRLNDVSTSLFSAMACFHRVRVIRLYPFTAHSASGSLVVPLLYPLKGINASKIPSSFRIQFSAMYRNGKSDEEEEIKREQSLTVGSFGFSIERDAINTACYSISMCGSWRVFLEFLVEICPCLECVEIAQNYPKPQAIYFTRVKEGEGTTITHTQNMDAISLSSAIEISIVNIVS